MADYKEAFEQEFAKQQKELAKANLAVVGGSGVGKSSLINRIFGKDVAQTGNGQAVTRGINRFEHPNLPVVFYDTEGYELRDDGSMDNNNFNAVVIPKIKELNAGGIKDQIHLVWYCLSIANHRITDFDIKNIRFFKEAGMKTAVVFTQCDNDEELPDGSGKDANAFRAIIQAQFPGIPCFETSATRKDLELDIEKLTNWSSESLPTDQLRRAFNQAQISSIPLKKKEAWKIVIAAAATTAATGAFNPIPVSDALLIAPQQLAMCVSITTLFWKTVDLKDGIVELLKTQILSMMGKQAASSLVKLIPGFGQAINGIIAGGITTALGAALVESNARALETFLNTGSKPDWMSIFNAANFGQAVKEHANIMDISAADKNKENT